MKNIMRLLTRTKCHNKAYPIPTQSMVLNLVLRKFSTSINMTINPYLQLQSKNYPVKFNVNTLQAFILYLEMKLLKCNLLRFPFFFFFYQATNQFPSMHLKMKIVLANGHAYQILQTVHFSMSITCRLYFGLRLNCCPHKHTLPSIESELFQGQCYQKYTVLMHMVSQNKLQRNKVFIHTKQSINIK